MLIYVLVISIFSYMLAITFPGIYSKVRQNTLQHYRELEDEEVKTGIFPLIAITLFLMPLIVFYFSGDVLLSIYCFVLAIVAYTDLSARWIPDFLIYILLAIAVYSMHSKEILSTIFAVIFFITPAALLNVYGAISKGEQWIASGDFYVFPSLGIMMLPEYAAALMIVSLFIALIITRWIPKVPLITVLYVAFSGYLLCEHYGQL